MFKKVLCILFALSMVFTCACKDNTADSTSDSSTSSNVEKPVQTKPTTGVINDDPNHYWEIYETDQYLLKDSQSDYSLLIPKDAGQIMLVAVDEFNLFFEEATGVKLPVVYDDHYEASGKFVSLGETKLLESNGLKSDESLKSNGFKIQTNGDDLFLYGNSERSALYAVYDLMSNILNYDYFIDTYTLDKDVKEIPLKNYNVTEIPDIEERATTYNVISADAIKSYRARQISFYDYFASISGLPWHNVMACLPLEKYYAEHPKWYAASKTQLSYCAQGDEAEYKLMVQTVADVFKRELIAQPDRNYITLTVMDDMEFDNSAAQQEITKKYGAESASIILFLNDVNKIIREWFASDEGKPYDRDLKILFFAYNRAEDAPVSWNEEKQCYEGNNGIKCDDGVSVFWAPINLDYMHSVYDATNKQYYELGKKWSAISDEIVLWTYSIFYPEYLIPYNNFNSMQSVFQYAKELGVGLLFNESEDSGESMPSCYGGLKAYLEQKLMWNTELNVAELTDKYFASYYGEFGDEMQKIFNGVVAYTTYLKDYTSDYDGVFSVHNAVLKESLWNKQTLLGWYNDYTKLLEEAAIVYAQDEQMYETVYKHIAVERLSTIYLLVQLYSYNTDAEFLQTIKQQFKDDHYLIGGMRCTANGSSTDVEYLFEEWGI